MTRELGGAILGVGGGGRSTHGGEMILRITTDFSVSLSKWRRQVFGLSSLTVGLIFALIAGLVYGLGYGLAFGTLFGMVGGLFFGLNSGLIVGLLLGLGVGLGQQLGATFGSIVQYFLLRLVLYLHGYIPWDYPHFLNHCTDRIFLQKVGAGYMFIHRLLMEYFAELETTQTA